MAETLGTEPNTTNGTLRKTCALWILLSPLFMLNVTIGNAAKAMSFYNFWGSSLRGHSVKEKCIETAKDVTRVVLAPIALLGLEFAAIWGLFKPLDGRKLLCNIQASFAMDSEALSKQRLLEALHAAKTLKADTLVDQQVRDFLCDFCNGLNWHLLGGQNWSRELVEQAIAEYFATDRVD